MDKREEIIQLYTTTNMFYKEIASEVGVSYKVVWEVIHKNFSEDVIHERTLKNWSRSKTEGNNASRGRKGEDAFHWNGGEAADGKGYMMVSKPEWYTGRNGSRYVFKHQVVICEALGLPEMPASWVVHHIDGDKTNNSLSNLALCTQAAHTRGHQKGFFSV